MKIKTLAGEKGLTLVEVLLSVGLMVLVLLSSFYVLTAAHQMSEESRSRLLALNSARTALETIKDTPLLGVPGINTVNFVPRDLPGGAVAITTNPANLAGAVVATVTVTVTWLGPKNMPRSLQMTTMRSQF